MKAFFVAQKSLPNSIPNTQQKFIVGASSLGEFLAMSGRHLADYPTTRDRKAFWLSATEFAGSLTYRLAAKVLVLDSGIDRQGGVGWQQEQVEIGLVESLRNTIMLGLTDQGRIRIKFRKKNEEDSEKPRSERKAAEFSTGRGCGVSHRLKLRTFGPALLLFLVETILVLMASHDVLWLLALYASMISNAHRKASISDNIYETSLPVLVLVFSCKNKMRALSVLR